jgi:hypothetical protein
LGPTVQADSANRKSNTNAEACTREQATRRTQPPQCRRAWVNACTAETRRYKAPKTTSNTANHGTMPTPRWRACRKRHGHMIVRAIPAPAIALTITMPHAWVNINTAAASPRRCDPICATCDIQATLRAWQRTGCRCGSRRCRVAYAKISPFFCTQARERAPNVSPRSRGTRCGHQRTIRALAMFHAGSLPHFAATVASEDVIEAVVS